MGGPSRLIRRQHDWGILARWSSVAATALGVGGLIGWLLGIADLARPIEGLLPIAPATAACIALAGAALAISRPGGRARRLAAVAAASAGALAAAALAEAALGIRLGATEFMPVRAWAWGAPYPPSALAAILMGCASASAAGLSLPGRAWRRIGEAAAVAGLALSLSALMEPAHDLAFYGAAGFLLISWAALAAGQGEAANGSRIVPSVDGPGFGTRAARVAALLAAAGAGTVAIADRVSSAPAALPPGLGLPLIALAILGAGALLSRSVARLAEAIDARRLAAERELAARLRREEIAHEVAYAGTWEWNLETDRLSASRPLRDMLGVAPDAEPSWEAFDAKLHPDDRPRVVAERRREWRPGERFDVEFRLLVPDGAARWMRTTGTLVEDAGRYMVGLAVDVTERRRFEEALRAASREAAEARAARSRFVAGVSHELRQPAQSLVLYLDLLRRGASGPALPVVEGVEEAANAIGRLVDTMLEISRLDAGLVSVRREPVHLDELVHRLAREYGRRAADLGLAFRVVPCGASVDSDPAILERILRALLDNALRFTARGRVLLGCRRRGGAVLLTVADSGTGIPEDKLGQVFEDFWQTETPVRGRAKGFGLGLPLARRLADLLDHRIHLRSHPGRGSLFAVEIPLSAVAARRPARRKPAEAEPKPQGGLLVAVIEDDPIVRNGIRAALTAWGHAVIDGASADEVTAALEGAVPDVIVADYLLRGQEGGIEAVKAIRQACRWPVPGLVLTGGDETGLRPEAERAGMPVLRKPVPPDELRSAIEAVIAGTPWSR